MSVVATSEMKRLITVLLDGSRSLGDQVSMSGVIPLAMLAY